MKHTLVILLFSAAAAFSQSGELTLLRGRITCPIRELAAINITNLRSEAATTSNENGSYSMFVKVGDTIQFTSVQIETHKIVVRKEDLAKSLLATSLTPKTIHLAEVAIKDYSHINAVSLRILEKPAKKYTPAERRLRAAEEFHWYSPLLIPLGGMSFDGLLNAISGRTSMLVKELQVERKEKMLLKIENQFEPKYVTDKLKIPAAYVKGFYFYIVEDAKLVDLINAKSKGMAEFRLSELATTYLAMVKNGD